MLSHMTRLWRGHGLTWVLVTRDSSLARRAQRTGVMTSGLLTIRPDSLAT
jgi:predicted ABC-type transport system involved in lysophospholipase L1 biosynthesis ATPase subunit